MKLAVITPVKTPEELKGDIHYILAHMLFNPEYYKECYETSLYKLIDNSVHEGKEVPYIDYINHSINLSVDEIILQDVMNNARATIERKESQLDLYEPYLRDAKIKKMFSIQGETINDILYCLNNGLNDPRIDTIGVSFTLTPKDFGESYYVNGFLNRAFVLEEISRVYATLKQTKRKPIHMLGLNSWLEPVLYSKYPFIRSCDSKLLVRISKFHYQNILDMFPMGKPSGELDLDEPLSERELDALTINLLELKHHVHKMESLRRYL